MGVHHYVVGDPHRIPWLTNQMAPPKGAMWLPKQKIIKKTKKTEEERSFSHSTLSLHSLSLLQVALQLLTFRLPLMANLDQRRRWRPANRGAAAVSFGEQPPQNQNSQTRTLTYFGRSFQIRHYFLQIPSPMSGSVSTEEKKRKP